MQIMSAFVLLLSFLTISLAANVTVYNTYDFRIKESKNVAPVLETQLPFEFFYYQGDEVLMDIIIKIKPSVLHNITYDTDDDGTIKIEKVLDKALGEYYRVTGTAIEVKIMLNLYKSNLFCSSLLVAKGRRSDSRVYGNIYLYDVCPKQCVLKADLTHECDDPVPSPPPEKDQSINYEPIYYVIASVIGMCVIILVVYLSIKKYRHRNSDRVEAIELNTYATTNEVLYADLSLAHGESQPPKREEESPYAQIIGVMKPVDG